MDGGGGGGGAIAPGHDQILRKHAGEGQAPWPSPGGNRRKALQVSKFWLFMARLLRCDPYFDPFGFKVLACLCIFAFFHVFAAIVVIVWHWRHP